MGGAWVSGTIPDPRSLGLDFAFTAAFIAVLRAMWRGRESLLPWLVSAGVVVVLTKAAGLDATLALILGGICGAGLAGMRGDG
jgi:predicted branched-subunit amino acid permease